MKTFHRLPALPPATCAVSYGAVRSSGGSPTSASVLHIQYCEIQENCNGVTVQVIPTLILFSIVRFLLYDLLNPYCVIQC